VHSVELVLADDAERAVRANWSSLTRSGLPSQGRHTGASNRPHLTLALTATVTEPVQRRLAAIAGDLPVELTVGALLVFGNRRFILSRLVVPNGALLGLQQRVLAALDEPVDRHGTFRAGAWTPHTTLGRRFTAGQLASAVTALGHLPAVSGRADRLRLWDMQAHREFWPGAPPGDPDDDQAFRR
jgi:2'-5' RNA ligase